MSFTMLQAKAKAELDAKQELRGARGKARVEGKGILTPWDLRCPVKLA
jgi:hypothetical protein